MRANVNMIVAVVAGVLFTHCNDKGESSHAAPAATSAAPAPLPTPEAPAPSESAGSWRNANKAPVVAPTQKVEIQIASVANMMAFDKTTLTVPAGAEVHLHMKNNATVDVLPHNWVLVRPGKEASVAAEGLKKASTTGYVVPGEDVIAYTPLTPPGKSSEVTFIAPEAGTYPYICTYPGHYVMMKGVLTVTP